MTEQQKNRLTVEIYGHKYNLMGEASNEHLQNVASYVNEKMNEINRKAPILDTTKIAVLTAVNIADELFRLKQEYEQLQNLLEEKTKE